MNWDYFCIFAPKLLRYMKKILYAIIALAVLTACKKDEEETEVKAGRTVLVYIAAENNLGYEEYIGKKYRNAYDDIQEMKEGVKTMGNNHLVVYVDKPNDPDPEFSRPIPYMLHFYKGELKDSIQMEESLTSDPTIFENVIRTAFTKYPADSYGLVLWGHGSGWLIENDSVKYNARKKAYGGDTGNNSYDTPGKSWMNIPSMAKALSRLPHLDFIFCDCCNMMCLEVAYELRHATDYIIGSPAEIPSCGAPYQTVVPAMFETNTLINDVPKYATSIVDKYYIQRAGGYDVPLSVIRTSEMENIASATKTVLKAIKPNIGDDVPNMTDLIHYYFDYKYYDANDFILKYATTDDYNAWKKALDKAVIYKKMATMWMTNKSWSGYYYGFTVTEEKYGGVSMHVPQSWTNQDRYSREIQQLQWYYAAGYNEIGW